MDTTYTVKQAQAAYFSACEVLHPQWGEVQELLGAGVSLRRANALYPLDLFGVLERVFTNPGAMKVAQRLTRLNDEPLLTMLSRCFLSEANREAWRAVAKQALTSPTWRGSNMAYSSQPKQQRSTPINALRDLHGYLTALETWSDGKGDTPKALEVNYRSAAIAAKLETTYLRPMLTNIAAALH